MSKFIVQYKKDYDAEFMNSVLHRSYNSLFDAITDLAQSSTVRIAMAQGTTYRILKDGKEVYRSNNYDKLRGDV